MIEETLHGSGVKEYETAGHTATSHRDANTRSGPELTVEFARGPGLLAVGSARLLFASADQLPWLEPLVATALAPGPAPEFLADVTRAWLQHGPSFADALAAEVTAQGCTVVALGAAVAAIETTETSQRIDAATARVVAELHAVGRLVRLASDSASVGAGALRFHGGHGVFPASAFLVRAAWMTPTTSAEPFSETPPLPAAVPPTAERSNTYVHTADHAVAVVEPDLAVMQAPGSGRRVLGDGRSLHLVGRDEPSGGTPAPVQPDQWAPLLDATITPGTSGPAARSLDSWDVPRGGSNLMSSGAHAPDPTSRDSTRADNTSSPGGPDRAAAAVPIGVAPVSNDCGGLVVSATIDPSSARHDDRAEQPRPIPPSGPSSAPPIQQREKSNKHHPGEIAGMAGFGVPVAPSPFDADSPDSTVFPDEHGWPRPLPVDVFKDHPAPDDNRVFGALCAGGHFTDPGLSRCLFCGGTVDITTASTGPRPTLGYVEFDDGRALVLDRGAIVGRNPALADDRAAAHLVAFSDDRMLSRVHLEIRLVDWQVMVVDRQSANGATVDHGDGRRVAARPNITTPLVDGSTVHFGKHHFIFRRARL